MKNLLFKIFRVQYLVNSTLVLDLFLVHFTQFSSILFSSRNSRFTSISKTKQIFDIQKKTKNFFSLPRIVYALPSIVISSFINFITYIFFFLFHLNLYFAFSKAHGYYKVRTTVDSLKLLFLVLWAYLFLIIISPKFQSSMTNYKLFALLQKINEKQKETVRLREIDSV